MKTLTFICITLLSGAIAGTLLGLINQVVVEPYIDKAIGIQDQVAINAGQVIDPGTRITLSNVAERRRDSCSYNIWHIIIGIIWSCFRL